MSVSTTWRIYLTMEKYASWYDNDVKWLRWTRDTLRPISHAQSPPNIRPRAQKLAPIVLGPVVTNFDRIATNI